MAGYGKGRIWLLTIWVLSGALLLHCGRNDDPFPLPDKIPPTPQNPGTGNPSSQGACTLNFQAKLVLNLVSSVADLAGFEQQIAGPIPLHVSNNADFVILGDEFPPIVFSKADNPRLGNNGINSITISGIPGSEGVGTLDGTGNITLSGLGLHVSSDPSIVTADLSDLNFTTGNTPAVTGTSKDNPPTKTLSANGSALDSSTLKMALATSITVPTGVPLLGGGAVTAVLDGTSGTGGLDKSPADPSCAGSGSGSATASGPSDIVVKKLEGNSEQEIAGNLLNFGEVFVGEGRKKEITLRFINRGSGALQISAFEKSSESIPFEVVSSSDSPITGSVSVGPGASRDVKIRFQPTSVLGNEEYFSGALTIHSNDVDQPEITLFLSGLGLTPGPRLKLSTLFVSQLEGVRSYAEMEETDFGTVYFPNLSVTPARLLKSFRVTNTGVQDLAVKELAAMTNEFSYGVVRFGTDPSVPCGPGQDPLKPADHCSILVTQKFFGTPAEKGPVTLPPVDESQPDLGPHLEVLVGYQPVNFNSLDQSNLTVKAEGGLSKTVRLIGHVDSSDQALLKLWVDETPADSTDPSKEILVTAGRIYNFGVLGTAITKGQVRVKVQNGGGAGGSLLKIVSAGVTLTGDSNFSLDKSIFDPSLNTGLQAPSGILDGRRNLALANLTRPDDRREIRSAQLTIQAKSVSPVTLAETALPPFTIDLIYGLPSGNLTFQVEKFIVGIKSPATAKPISTIDGQLSVGLPLQIDFNNKGSAKILKLLSRQPNFEDAPDCPGNGAERKACAAGLAPFRIQMRLLADNWDEVDLPNDQGVNPAGVCMEGNYNGVWQVGNPAECSYMAISLAGAEGSDFHNQVLKDSNPNLSMVTLNLPGRKARLTLPGLKIRFLDSEHALMLSGPTSYFDHILGLTLSTGAITPDLTNLLSDTFVPLEGSDSALNNINTPPLSDFICDGVNDGDSNPPSCTLPGTAPVGTGLLMGEDWDLTTGEISLVGVTKLTHETRQNLNDEFFGLLNPSPLYLVLKGKICGDSIGVPCH